MTDEGVEPDRDGYSEWRRTFPSRPSRRYFDSSESIAASARLLAGYPPRFAGQPGQFFWPLFGRRADLFNGGEISGKGYKASGNCSFYERLWTTDDLIVAMHLDRLLAEHGVDTYRRPRPDLMVQIFKSMYGAPMGAVPLPDPEDPEDRFIGNHVVTPIGTGGGRIFFVHNWGQGWGDKGIGSFSLDYVKRFQQEAWSIRVNPGPKPTGLRKPIAWGPSEEHFTQLLSSRWDRPDRTSWENLYHGVTIDIFGRWLIGVVAGSISFQCIALFREAKGVPVIVGWMHIGSNSDGPYVEELFVWPPYRERGIGTALVGHALLYITYFSTPEMSLTWYEQEADAAVRQRSPLKPYVPHWLRDLPWRGSPGVALILHGRLTKLLRQLAQTQVADGVHLIQGQDKGLYVTNI